MELIPLKASNASYQVETVLDGTSYILTVRWNFRESSWYLHIETTDGVVVVGSRKLVPGSRLLRYVVGTARPPGELVLVDTMDAGGTPGFDDLGARYVLVYGTGEEMHPASVGSAVVVA